MEIIKDSSSNMFLFRISATEACFDFFYLFLLTNTNSEGIELAYKEV
jgi:hypothetical protein